MAKHQPAPLPFPVLPEDLLAIMARQPEAPHTEQALWERARVERPGNDGVTLDNIRQALMRLENLDLVMTGHNSFSGVKNWRLTQAGKLNQGIC